jgi:three-Cys-motif partner protein
MGALPQRSVDPAPQAWPTGEELVLGPDGLPARKVKAHNAHKAHYIQRYSQVVAGAMKNKWGARCYIDLYSGPGLCWVEDTGAFVPGSPLIALDAEPSFDYYVFVDMDSECCAALEERTAGSGAVVRCFDSNTDAAIEWVRSAIPRRGALSLVLLDPQGCTLQLDTIRKLTYDRRMDLLINLPIQSLLRCLAANHWHVLDAVLGEDWPRTPVPAWRAAVRQHYRAKLAELGYRYSPAKEVRGERTNNRLYDFILASRHPLAEKLFVEVTRETAHGQTALDLGD